MRQVARTGTSKEAVPPTVPGISPQLYSEQDFERISRLVHQEAGIVLGAAKKMLAYSRIAPLVRASGLQTFSDYIDLIEKDAEKRTRAVSSLTTNHTYFYREPHHFEHFTEHVRPKLLGDVDAGKRVRIWSAGCSSGEEIYTLMMVLLGTEKRLAGSLASRDFAALASDLADHAVEAASEGKYQAEALSKLPAGLADAWCEEVPDTAQLVISRKLRDLIRFRRLNLLGSWPISSAFDVIFCRNVMIYFDEPTKEALVLRLARALKPGGHLYIGHSERVSGEAAQYVESLGSTIYKRKAS